jgi:hypothetical protein
MASRAKRVTTSARTIGDVRTRRDRAPRVIPRRRCFAHIEAQIETDQRIVGGDSHTIDDTTGAERQDARHRGAGQV